MKIKKTVLLILVNCVLFTLTSCSDNSDNDNPTTTELLIGEWLVITESDYFCGTDVVYNERLTDPNQVYVFLEDGTWHSFENEIPDQWAGTWENIGNDNYAIYYSNDDVTQITSIEFPNNDTMNFGAGECYESQGESYDTWTVWLRQ